MRGFYEVNFYIYTAFFGKFISIINEVGSLGIISAAIADYGGNITNLNLTEKDTDFYNLRIDIDVDDKGHIDNIVKSLKGLPEVNSVERLIH